MTVSGSSYLLLGDLGEDKLKSWCTLCGALATKANPDRMGWDYFVELDPILNPHKPLDSQGWLPKFLVQVKSTRSVENNFRIKLSSIKRLVDTDLPAFIFVIKFDESNKYVKSYVIHVGEMIISNVLRDVRRRESMGNTEINKVYYKLRFGEDNKINLDEVEGFKFCSEVASDPKYSYNKSEFRQSVGFGKDCVKLKVVFDGGVNRTHVEDMFIGVADGLPLKKFSISRERFGIPLASDVDLLGSGVLKVTLQSAKAGVVRVSRQSDGAFYDLKCQVLVAPFSDPSEGVKFRVFNDHLNIIADTKIQSFNFDLKIEENKAINISELRDLLNFVSLLSEEESLLEVFVGKKLIMTGSSISGVEKPILQTMEFI